ncbi:hypothetical protein LOAG_18977, partial [Loa loa]
MRNRQIRLQKTQSKASLSGIGEIRFSFSVIFSRVMFPKEVTILWIMSFYVTQFE